MATPVDILFTVPKLFRFKDRSHVAQAIFCVTENRLELLDPLASLSKVPQLQVCTTVALFWFLTFDRLDLLEQF